MKVGDRWQCPHCGQDSFLKKEPLMDGWTRIGEVLQCASCSAPVETHTDAEIEAGRQAADPAGTRKAALAALLGETAPDSGPVLSPEEKRFCRDCEYRVMTAFRIYCPRLRREVAPLADCPDFKRRKDG